MNEKFWDFLAILFGLYGIIISGAGVYYWLIKDFNYRTQFHPSIWWGMIMFAAAVVFFLFGRRSSKA